MKKNLKFISIVMALVLLISVFSVVNVSAADVTYSATSVKAQKGDTITINVNISTAVKLWGANVSLSYNSAELQYVSSSTGDAVSQGNLYNTGSSVNFSGTYKATKGTVFTVKFKVLKDIGASTLKLSSSENIDYNEKQYTCSATNGVVTIIDSSKLPLGDANGDGLVSSVDARHILQYLAELRILDDDAQMRADVNKDGLVTSVDARWILQYLAELRVF